MIIFSELHAHNYSPVMGSEYLKLSVGAMQQVREYALGNKEKVIVHCGDLFQLKDRIPTEVIVAVSEELMEWEKAGLRSYWLKGNHDFLTVDTLNLLNPFKLANTVLEPEVIVIEGFTCYFVPYHCAIEPLNADILFMHDMFSDVDYGGYKGDSDVSTAIGNNYKLVFAGHCHKAMEVAKNVWHIGSPYQTNFGEVGQRKHFAVVKPDEVAFRTFEFPQLVQIDDKHIMPQECMGKYVKIKIVMSTLSDVNIAELKREAMLAGAKGVVVETEYRPEEKRRIDIEKMTSDASFIEAYVNNQKDLSHDDKERLIYAGKGIIAE